MGFYTFGYRIFAGGLFTALVDGFSLVVCFVLLDLAGFWV